MAVYMVEVGNERIVVGYRERAKRYVGVGVSGRCQILMDRYLQGKVSVSPGDRVINFGANAGELCLAFAARGAHILAIEPDPNIWEALYRNTVGKDVEIMPVAAWSSDGPLKMFVGADPADTSAFNESAETIMSAGMTLDTIVAQKGYERIKLLIGDAQGAEPEVLDGARISLKRTEFVSVCASAERCGERTLEACESILLDEGFTIIVREENKFCTLIGKNNCL